MKIDNMGYPILLIALLFGCGSPEGPQSSFRIDCEIAGLKADSVYIENTSNDSIIATPVNNGHFAYSGRVSHPQVFNIYLKRTPTEERFFRLFIENAEIKITGNADSINSLKIAGSKSHSEYAQFQKSIQSIRDEMSSTDQAFNKAAEVNNMDLADSLAELYNVACHKRLESVFDYVKRNRSSPIIPFITFSAIINAPDQVLLNSIIASADSTINDRKQFKGSLDLVGEINKITVGSLVPEFALTARDGKTVTSQSLLGKVFLIDFWASWCGPCRKNHPDLVDLYHNYKKKGFEIISISLDKKKNDWESAIKKDGLLWTQTCDLNGAQGTVAKAFGIAVIPASFLIDKNGHVVAKDLLRKKLRLELNGLL